MNVFSYNTIRNILSKVDAFTSIKSSNEIKKVFSIVKLIPVIPPIPPGSFILREDGFYILREDATKFMRENG